MWLRKQDFALIVYHINYFNKTVEKRHDITVRRVFNLFFSANITLEIGDRCLIIVL